MAYDKAIDSGKLNSALTATANAIRSKTGKTAKITWNESTGFASAVSAIGTGGGGDGVCESLTVNFTGGYSCEIIYASRNGEYDGDYVGGTESITLKNVDVNTPIFTGGSLDIYGFLNVPESTNIDILLLSEFGHCIFTCTSTEPASISIEVVG